MTNNSSKKDPTSHCFSTIIQRIVCGRSLPTHPTPPDPNIFEKRSNNITTFSNLLNKNDPDNNIVGVTSQIQVQAQVQVQGPGLVARLMGLESLPENNNNYESLFRSKSLNSLYFYPEFDPTRALFHRRARTSASFHEQSHNNFLVKIDENLEHRMEMKKTQTTSRVDSKQRKERRENVVKMKGNERMMSRKSESRRKNVNYNKKRYEEKFTSGDSNIIKHRLRKDNLGDGNNNLRDKNVIEKRKSRVIKEKNVKVNYVVGSNVTSYKRRVDYYKEDLNVELFQCDATSISPVSVLDHLHVFDSPSKEDERQVTSNSRKQSSPKTKIYNDMPLEDVINPEAKKNDNKGSNKSGKKHKLDKSEKQVNEHIMELLAQICMVVEDHVRDPKWMIKYERVKAHYIEELCADFEEEMLDFLLLEIMDELVE